MNTPDIVSTLLAFLSFIPWWFLARLTDKKDHHIEEAKAFHEAALRALARAEDAQRRVDELAAKHEAEMKLARQLEAEAAEARAKDGPYRAPSLPTEEPEAHEPDVDSVKHESSLS